MEDKKNNYHWVPNPWPQTEVLKRWEFEILYWWARWWGKTDAGMVWLLYDIIDPKYKALVIRRNADDLSDWIDRARYMYSPLNAEFTGKPTVIKFPSWSFIKTWHLKDENAYTKYQWHEYHKILIEELTQIPSEESYLKLISSCRSTKPWLHPQIFCTTNPDWPWHTWVRKRFVDVSTPWIKYIDPKSWRSRIYIPALIEDNPILMKNDPDYVNYLESLPDDLREARRNWSWECFETKWSYFQKDIQKMREDERICRQLYENWLPVYTFWDLGMSDSTVIIFVQIFWKEIRIIDLEIWDWKWLEYYINLINEKPYRYITHYAPHDISIRELWTGMSRLERAYNLWMSFEIVPKLEIAEWIQALRTIFNRIWIDEKENLLIEALQQYRKERDEKNQIFKDKPVHDRTSHYVDAMRYMAVMYNNIIQTTKVQVKKKYFNAKTGKMEEK